MKTSSNKFSQVIDLGQKKDSGLYRYHELKLTTIEGEELTVNLYLGVKPTLLELGYVTITELSEIVPVIEIEETLIKGATNDKRIIDLYNRFLMNS